LPDIALISAAGVAALLCATTMGFAIQRGGTCMVAAVEEVVAQRRASRLIAMLEAGLWVAAGLLFARTFGHLAMAPATYPIGLGTILGGALLGLGALVNRGCTLGSIARIGSGQWAFLATPAGFFLGCRLAGPHLSQPAPDYQTSPLFGHWLWLAVPVAAYAAWRGWGSLRNGWRAPQWAPHQATMVIGLAFVALMLLAGNWAYTQVLADAARGMVMGQIVRIALFGGLLSGAILGGWSAGLIRPTVPTMQDTVRCLTGGALMGVGGLLVPGGNDGLVLLGLPLLLPYAWVALASMVLAIGAGMLVAGRAFR